jgi:hypothetical protein
MTRCKGKLHLFTCRKTNVWITLICIICTLPISFKKLQPHNVISYSFHVILYCWLLKGNSTDRNRRFACFKETWILGKFANFWRLWWRPHTRLCRQFGFSRMSMSPADCRLKATFHSACKIWHVTHVTTSRNISVPCLYNICGRLRIPHVSPKISN